MYYFEYIIYMLPALIISLLAQIAVKSSFAKYSKVASSRGWTAADTAKFILREYGINNVQVERVSGSLTDHYDPKSNVVRLSDSVFGSTSIGSIGVAAHEVGHAIQHSLGYFPIKIRSAIIPVCNFGSAISPYLLIFGLIFNSSSLFYLGILAFCLVAFFQLVTLPVEFNASRRAIRILEDRDILSDYELKGAKKVLTAAALTYVSALITSFFQILYYLSRFQRNNRR